MKYFFLILQFVFIIFLKSAHTWELASEAGSDDIYYYSKEIESSPTLAWLNVRLTDVIPFLHCISSFLTLCPRASLLQSLPCMPGERVALCAGCGRKIADRYYLLAVDKQWHMRCLKCCECKLNLESELTCFSKDGSIYCKEDYYR